MGWFDEQIKYRKEKDAEVFTEAVESIAEAVMGKKLKAALDKREIAISAIGEILRYYHCKMKKDELPPKTDTVDEQLEYYMRPFGIMRRTVTLERGWYRHAVGPMLGTLKKDGSAVALIPGGFSGYSFMDLSTGKRQRLNRRTEKLIDREAVCFYKPLPLKSLKIRDLLVFMAEQLTPADIVLYIGMMLLTALLGLLSPVLTKLLFGKVLQSGSARVLAALASFMISFSISKICLSTFQNLINARVEIKQDTAVQAAVMSRIMSLPADFFKNYASGELTQRAQYVQSLCSVIMNTIGTTGLTSVFSLVYIWQIFSFAPALVMPSLLITLATVVLSILTAIVQMRYTREMMHESAELSGMSYSMITGIQKIKLAGAEQRMFSRWAKKYSIDAGLRYNCPSFLKFSDTFSLAISLIGTLVLYYFAAKNDISVADYYAFNSAYGMVSAAFMSFAAIAATIAGIRPTLEMSKPILEAEPELTEGKEEISSLRGGIELCNVSFKYADDMPNIIDNLSLKIKPGEYVAVVGTTGCGKSTLVRLLLGFEKPQRGAIYYDRKDISKIDLKSLRSKIGVVMQDGKLFLGDIFSNIVISAPQLTLAEAWEAAEIASVADDIREMPMGMNTVICEGQGGISGGQKQRLMIARAVAPKPKILILDEATSALDNITQRKVSEAIDTLKCTRIVVAHRLSTIRRCDRIIVLDKGKIVEDGSYEKLMELNGAFARLVERQTNA